MADNLKPCPFCGAQPKISRESLDERSGYADRVKVQCPSCSAYKSAQGDSSKGGYADNSTTEQRAVEAWNRRAAPPVGEDGLPRRPKAEHYYQASGDSEFGANWKNLFTEDQYIQGQREAYEAGRRAAVPAQTGTQPAGDSVDTPEFRELLRHHDIWRADDITIIVDHITAWVTRRAAVSTASAPAEDPVVEANRQMLLDRSRVGIGKYGTTLAGAGLDRGQLVQHALEEALDLANYLQALLREDAR